MKNVLLAALAAAAALGLGAFLLNDTEPSDCASIETGVNYNNSDRARLANDCYDQSELANRIYTDTFADDWGYSTYLFDPQQLIDCAAARHVTLESEDQQRIADGWADANERGTFYALLGGTPCWELSSEPQPEVHTRVRQVAAAAGITLEDPDDMVFPDSLDNPDRTVGVTLVRTPSDTLGIALISFPKVDETGKRERETTELIVQALNIEGISPAELSELVLSRESGAIDDITVCYRPLSANDVVYIGDSIDCNRLR